MIGKTLKTFRIEVLKLTLSELCEGTDVSFKTISALENGRSSNVNHIKVYVQKCDAEKRRQLFNELMECF